jgi:MFS family permease
LFLPRDAVTVLSVMAFNVFGGIGRALAVPAYRDYAIGNLISTIGRWAQRIASGWLVWELTQSEVWLGIAAFADLAPALCVPILGGVITDRIGSVVVIRLMLILGAIAGAVLTALTFTGAITIGAVIALVAMLGFIEAFSGPARATIVHTLVPRAVMASAIASNTAMFNASRLIGPAIAGPIILTSGVTAVFAFNAVSYVIFLILTVRVHSDRTARTNKTTNILGEIGEAITAVRNDPGLRFIMLLMGLSGILTRPVIEFLPAFSAQVFGGGAGTMSFLLATLGTGALVSSLLLARRGELRGLTRIVVGAHLGMSLGCVIFSFIDLFWLAVLAFAAYGFFLPVCSIGAQTLVQSSVSGHMRARVMSLLLVISFGSPALGALLEGWIASFVGLQVTVGVGAALAAVWWLWARHQVPALEGELERPR